MNAITKDWAAANVGAGAVDLPPLDAAAPPGSAAAAPPVPAEGAAPLLKDVAGVECALCAAAAGCTNVDVAAYAAYLAEPCPCEPRAMSLPLAGNIFGYRVTTFSDHDSARARAMFIMLRATAAAIGRWCHMTQNLPRVWSNAELTMSGTPSSSRHCSPS